MSSESMKNYLKRAYKERKANGMCVVNGCGNKPTNGLICQECKDKRRQSFKDSGAITLKIHGKGVMIIDKLRLGLTRSEFVNKVIEDLE